MTLTPASPPSPNPDLPTTTPTTTTTTTNPENLHAPSTTAMPTQSESDEPLNWERPRTPTKRAFFTPVTQFFSSKRQKVNFDQDTEYHAPSKEKKNGILAGGVGGATAGLATSSGRSNGVGFQERFDNLMPAHRTYLGRSRKVFLIGVGIIFLCLLALILGLGIGLSKKNSSHKSLPLPTTTTIQTGDITYYDPGGPGFGSCGLVSYSTSSICAISHILYDAASTSSNPNNNPLCGKQIRITRFDSSEGKNNSVDVKVVDRCVGCATDDLDLSESMFADLADVSLGRVVASWAWLD